MLKRYNFQNGTSIGDIEVRPNQIISAVDYTQSFVKRSRFWFQRDRFIGDSAIKGIYQRTEIFRTLVVVSSGEYEQMQSRLFDFILDIDGLTALIEGNKGQSVTGLWGTRRKCSRRRI